MSEDHKDNYQFESLKTPSSNDKRNLTRVNNRKKVPNLKFIVFILFSLFIGFRWRYSFGGKLILINSLTVLIPYLILCVNVSKKRVRLQTIFAISTSIISFAVGIYGYSRDSVSGLLTGDKEITLREDEGYEVRIYTRNKQDIVKLNIKSTNQDVVQVFKGGVNILAKEVGKADVSIFDDYGHKVKIPVSVSKKTIPSQYSSSTYSTIKVGESKYVGVSEIGGYSTFDIDSRDESIVGLNHSLMVALKEGTTTLDLSSETFPSISLEVSVVGKDDYVWRICKFDCLRYGVGETIDFESVIPDDAVNVKVTSDSDVFRVEGTKVRVLREGIGEINVSYDDTAYSVGFSIPKTKLQSASIADYNGSKLTIDKPHNLEVKTYPSDAIVENITYSSSDNKIATVDQNGLITPLGKGITFINVNIDGNDLDIPAFVE